MAIEPTTTACGFDSAELVDFSRVADDFAAAWDRGDTPAVEAYLDRLSSADSRAAVELIYREFCLAEASGWNPQVSDYLARFPQHKPELERLMRLHGECSPSLVGRWMETGPDFELPDVGDEIGPYVLRRELGRGGFARVFLAEQTNLENRLVVLKVSTRITREPWLLARVRHAHIVEILSHATADDGAFHLICMPFWGGATLAAVLARRRLRGRPRTGLDLLADLDSVAASEFPAVQRTRPAREIVAGLTYNQAVAWVAARLAEALDHAYSRDVAHGDVKPSNILLSADGNPMLLDFNLARDGSHAGLEHSVNDPGGTFAYMAPERLRALATFHPARADSSFGQFRGGVVRHPGSSCPTRIEGDKTQDVQGIEPHQADIYSLGMVLLEALTGNRPAPAAVDRDPGRCPDVGQFRFVAGLYAAARDRSADTLIRQSDGGGRRTTAPGLRAILERCLDPDPGRRYRRGLELAEDLDRWRADRPLIYASEPFWAQTVPRWLRRQRRALIVATAALSVLVGLPTTMAVVFTARQSLQGIALHKLARNWDDPEARTYGSQRPGSPRSPAPDDHQVLETALRALNDYDVLGPIDWRERDDVRILPAADREDLELWLMEQGYRYCRALDHRPELRREDWRRALAHIEHLTATRRPEAFAALEHRLRVKLGTETRESSSAPSGDSAGSKLTSASRSTSDFALPWLDEYLLGVASECEYHPERQLESQVAFAVAANRPVNVTAGPDAVAPSPRRDAQRALEHYRKVLAIRPDSYWGNYRAAVAFFALDHFDGAARHLERCLKRRPNNPVLHIFLAGCRQELGQIPEALRECNLALESAPDSAEWYRSRAFIRADLGQKSGLIDDIQHFELLSRILPRAFWSYEPLTRAISAGEAAGLAIESGSWLPPAITAVSGLDDRPAVHDWHTTGAQVDPEEVAARARLATKIFDADEYDLAAAELGKTLILDPDNIGIRMTRVLRALEAERFDAALRDLDLVLNHPGLFDYVREKEPTLIRCFHDASRRCYRSGRVEDGRVIARRALDLSIALKRFCAESHYNMARACAVSARTDPQFIGEAANQLFHAIHANKNYRKYYSEDGAFDAVRAQVDVVLLRMPERHRAPDPSTFRKTLAPSLAKAR